MKWTLARMRVLRASIAALVALSACGRSAPTLTVFNAAALGPPFSQALQAFAGTPPSVAVAQENATSLEVVRKVSELGIIPDVLAVADDKLLTDLVLPKHATWFVRFGTNALVLAYGPKARFADEISTENWWKVLQRPGVEVGRSDLRIDPSGYRANFAMQLAERHYHVPGLTARLRATIPERNIRRAEADLSAHLQAGELDYGWTYENLARAHGLRYVKLPPEIDLSAPDLREWYAQASITLPGTASSSALTLRGAPIVFALTIPAQAPHPTLARDFVRFLLSDSGRALLASSGFTPLAVPDWVGAVPASLASARDGTGQELMPPTTKRR